MRSNKQTEGPVGGKAKKTGRKTPLRSKSLADEEKGEPCNGFDRKRGKKRKTSDRELKKNLQVDEMHRAKRAFPTGHRRGIGGRIGVQPSQRVRNKLKKSPAFKNGTSQPRTYHQKLAKMEGPFAKMTR